MSFEIEENKREAGTRFAIIDADSLVYAVGFASEGTYYELGINGDTIEFKYSKDLFKYVEEHFPDSDYTVTKKSAPDPLSFCLHSMKRMVEGILEAVDAADYKIFLTGTDNFRKDIYPEYKANRAESSKPTYYNELRDYLVSKYGAIVVDGMEADDAVAIEYNNLFLCKHPDGLLPVICSIDKDLDTVSGQHYNWNKPEQGMYWVSLHQASYNFYTQLLTGDATDNIPGIPGIGKAKAAKILDYCVTDSEMYAAAVKAYYDHYAKDILERNAQLLHMKRSRNDKWIPPEID